MNVVQTLFRILSHLVYPYHVMVFEGDLPVGIRRATVKEVWQMFRGFEYFE